SRFSSSCPSPPSAETLTLSLHDALPIYVNPTTSSRFDAYMPALIRGLRLTSVGGKGGMGAACVEAMREVGCVYFSLPGGASPLRSEEHTSELQSRENLVCRLLLEKKKNE